MPMARQPPILDPPILGLMTVLLATAPRSSISVALQDLRDLDPAALLRRENAGAHHRACGPWPRPAEANSTSSSTSVSFLAQAIATGAVSPRFRRRSPLCRS